MQHQRFHASSEKTAKPPRSIEISNEKKKKEAIKTSIGQKEILQNCVCT